MSRARVISDSYKYHSANIGGVTYPDNSSGEPTSALTASSTGDSGEAGTQTLLIIGSHFTSTVTVTIDTGSSSAFAGSTSVNADKTIITCANVTARAAGRYVVTVTNSDGIATTTVVEFSSDPTFATAASLTAVKVGSTLNQKLLPSGGNAPFAYSEGSPAMPSWMSLDSATGVLSGVTENSGAATTHDFSIIVKDRENQGSSREFSLLVGDDPASTGDSVVDFTIDGVEYRFHCFTTASSSTSFVVNYTMTMDILCVAGGGGGGSSYAWSTGGGGGGILFNSTTNFLTTNTSLTIQPSTYTVVVGAGGANATNGADSRFYSTAASFDMTAKGGGCGSPATSGGQDGGSSGGGYGSSQGPITGSSNDPATWGAARGESYRQGYRGGKGLGVGGDSKGGGGGGAGGTPADATSSSGGHGGSGKAYTDFLSNTGSDGPAYSASPAFGHRDSVNVYFSGGGGGGTQASGGHGSGTHGGGGYATAGASYTGSGAGVLSSGTGGSGVVIIRYVK